MISLASFTRYSVGIVVNIVYLISIFCFALLTIGYTESRTILKRDLAREGVTWTASNATTVLGWMVLLLMLFTLILGCVAFYKHKASLIRMYAILLVASLLLQTLMMAMTMKGSDEMKLVEIKHLYLPKLSYGSNPGDKIARKIHFIQLEHSCCGIDSYIDYFGTEEIPGLARKHYSIPNSCCANKYKEDDRSRKGGTCPFEEFSTRPACGRDLFLATFHGFHHEELIDFKEIIVFYQLLVLTAAGLSIYSAAGIGRPKRLETMRKMKKEYLLSSDSEAKLKFGV